MSIEYCGQLKRADGDGPPLYYDIRLDSASIKLRVTDCSSRAWQGDCLIKDVISNIKNQGPKASRESLIEWLGQCLQDNSKATSTCISKDSLGLVINASFDYGRPYALRLPASGELQMLSPEETQVMIFSLAASSLVDKKRLGDELKSEKQRSDALNKKLEKDLRSGRKEFEKIEGELEQLRRESAALLGKRQEAEVKKSKPNPFDLILGYITPTQPLTAPTQQPIASTSASQQPPIPTSSAAQPQAQEFIASPLASQTNGSVQSQSQAGGGGGGKDPGVNLGVDKKRSHEASSLGPVVVQGLAFNGRGKAGKGGGRPRLG